MFQSGIDEQHIMAVTGHRSIDAVRVYKEMSHEQEQELSKVIQPQSKKPKTDDEKKEKSKDKHQTYNFTSCNVVINNY